MMAAVKAPKCEQPAISNAWHRPRRRMRFAQPARAGLLDALLRMQSQQPLTVPCPEEDPQGAALLTWAQQHGLPPQKLGPALLPGCGRGLVATEPIAAGEPLLRVPAALVLTAEAAVQQSLLAQALLAGSSLPAWTVLALWLVEARAAGASHPWAPYLATLPESAGSVVSWPAEHVDWLRGSHLRAIAAEVRAAAERSAAELLAALGAARGTAGAPGLPQQAHQLCTREQLGWAFDVLLSRLVRLDGLGGAEALVPWADCLNHDCRATAHLDWDAGAAGVVLRAERGYRRGEEVRISYGRKTSGQLLLSYGFAPANNPHDACLLELALPGGGAAMAAAEAHGYAGGRAVFPLRMEAVPEEMIQFAALAAAEASGAGQAERLAADVMSGGPLPAATRAAGLELIVRRCQVALTGYASSMEADTAELAELEAGNGGSGIGCDNKSRQRRRVVLRLLLAERRVLHRTIFLLQQQLRAVRRGRG